MYQTIFPHLNIVLWTRTTNFLFFFHFPSEAAVEDIIFPSAHHSPGIRVKWSPLGQTVKHLPTMQQTGFDPWVGKILWRRKWQPTPVLLPGKSHGWRSMVGYSPWGHKESDTTEQLHLVLVLEALWKEDIWYLLMERILIRANSKFIITAYLWEPKCIVRT